MHTIFLCYGDIVAESFEDPEKYQKIVGNELYLGDDYYIIESVTINEKRECCIVELGKKRKQA